MLKKCLSLLILFAILIGFAPLNAHADSESGRIIQEIQSIYSKVQKAVGRYDLRGLCGTMVGYQLYYMGINSSPLILDGKDQFDAYEDMEVTSGGHSVRAYSSQAYTLQEALYEVTNGGTKNVYNLLIGFQWTTSTAGRKYGHAVVVNAILDGVMYFCEAFNTPFDITVGGASICTIDEFAADYGKWSGFDGLIYFGQGKETDFCEEYNCHAFLQTIRKTDAKDAPSMQQGVSLRTVKQGERLEATGLYKNRNNELYYSIVDSGKTAFVRAEDVTVLSMRYDDVQIQNAAYPEVLRPGESFAINGILQSSHNEVHNVAVRIVDELGQEQDFFLVPVDGRYKNLSATDLKKEIQFQHLPQGNYILEISAEVVNHYAKVGSVVAETKKCILEEVPFAVGTSSLPAFEVFMKEITEDGWRYEEGVWRYYEGGTFRTGWFCYHGVDYYLLENGAAATGWQRINGKERFFTDTGAMRTGWLEQEDAVYYLLSNGEKAVGERTIDGVTYRFSGQGLLIE